MPKSQWFIIDGYNLLYASGVFGTVGRTALEASREALLDWLAAHLGEQRCRRTTIVFDAREAPPGLPRSATKHGIQIQFAPRGGEADEVIEELIGAHTSPRRLIVVSSDHRLHRAARKRRARAVDSEQWVMELRKSRPQKQAESDVSLDLDQPETLLDPDELKDMLDDFEDL